jgi:hypothetical protein
MAEIHIHIIMHQQLDYDICKLKAQCCPNTLARTKRRIRATPPYGRCYARRIGRQSDANLTKLTIVAPRVGASRTCRRRKTGYPPIR